MSVENLDKVNYNIPLMSPESVLSRNGDSPSHPSQGNLKRARTDDDGEIGYLNKLSNYQCPEPRSFSKSRLFLTVRRNNYVYHTEEWKPKGCTRYVPLHEDIMINTQNIEQISFECDQFFLADVKGNYVGAKPGNAIHLWRYDSSARKLFISRSILFLREQDFQDIQIQLDNL